MGRGADFEDGVRGEGKDRWGRDRSEQAPSTFQPRSGQRWGQMKDVGQNWRLEDGTELLNRKGGVEVCLG